LRANSALPAHDHVAEMPFYTFTPYNPNKYKLHLSIRVQISKVARITG